MTMADLPEGFAPAPVSTQLVSGHVPVRRYAEAWAGNDRDILLPDREHSFTAVDMTAWAIAFLQAVDLLFTPAMTAATVALDPDRATSLRGHREQLVDAIAATLMPVLIVPGEVPAVDAAHASFREALRAGLAGAYAPAAGDGDPLRVCPPLPIIRAERAVEEPAPRSIAEALSWSYVLDIVAPTAAQDALLLDVSLNQAPARVAATAGAATAPTMLIALAPRPAARTLFEALARANFEVPQIVPHLEGVEAGGDVAVARAALKRMDALIGDVALTWPAWFAQPHGAPLAASGPASWHYAIDYAQNPLLGVTRAAGDGGALPPWPDIEGFASPPEDGQPSDTYRPMDGTATEGALTFCWAGLSALRVQDAHVAACVTRNAHLVPPGSPDGTRVDPSFIYRTPPVSGAVAIAPALDRSSQSFAVGAAAGLAATVEDVLNQCLAGPATSGVSARDARIELEASYRTSLSEGEMPIESGVPILLTRARLALSSSVAEGAITVAAFRAALIDALRIWHGATRPDDVGATLRLAMTLSAMDAAQRAPLARLGQIDIAIPEGRPDWWG